MFASLVALTICIAFIIWTSFIGFKVLISTLKELKKGVNLLSYLIIAYLIGLIVFVLFTLMKLLNSEFVILPTLYLRLFWLLTILFGGCCLVYGQRLKRSIRLVAKKGENIHYYIAGTTALLLAAYSAVFKSVWSLLGFTIGLDM